MNFAPYLRLMWKEYRAARLFWLAIAGLVVLFQLLTLATSPDVATTVQYVTSLALGGPVLFALGCAGAAFAMEREEGTYEFLRLIPASSRQVFVSKFALTVIATLAMYAVLCPMALAFTHGQLPNSATLRGISGLWLMAAVEALVWGMFFSLLTARPLLAICLAVAAATTIAHLLAANARQTTVQQFELLSYYRAMPWRAAVAAVVLFADVYLGVRWLRGDSVRRIKSSIRSQSAGTLTPALSQREGENDWREHARPDRGAAFTHLLWQHWRQSGRLMILIVLVGIPAVFMGVGFLLALFDSNIHQHGSRYHDFVGPVYCAVWAALMGACVFLPDQEQRRYRYFAEHNVPPRYVWLSRQLPWMIAAVIVSVIVCYLWLGYWRLRDIFRLLDGASNDWRGSPWENYRPWLDLPPIGLGLMCIALAAR